MSFPSSLILGYLSLLLSQCSPQKHDKDGYAIDAPKTYVAFSADLFITYYTPPGVSLPNAFIMLVSLRPRVTEVTTLGMPIDLRTRKLRVQCGVVEHAGQFAFRMYMYTGGKVLTETKVEVTWPKLAAQLPLHHVASTNAVPVTISSVAKCNPVFRRYTMYVHVLYYKENPKSVANSANKPVEISNASLPVISNAKITQSYTCSTFDKAGYYQAVIRSDYNISTTICRSNIMHTTWSARYNISSYVDSVFPCANTFTILTSQPPCDDTTDKIRVFSIHLTVSGSKAAPQRYNYVTEFPAFPGLRYKNLKCDLFSREAIGYCFYYVSVSNDGTIKRQTKYCVPTSPNSVLSEDGGWSDWSEWSVCSLTCGTGQQNRKRLCNNPAPYNGGRYCTGEPTEWRPCHNMCKDLLSRLTPLISAKVDQNCACGCKLTSPKGQIVATGRCHGLSLWPIRLPEGRRIRLKFIYYDLDTEFQWVKVRDGRSRDANLLVFSVGKSVLNDVTSSGNEMLIEFMTTVSDGVTWPQPKQDGGRIHGFIATYRETYVNNTKPSTDYTLWATIDSTPAWQSIMTIAGVIFCVIIVLSAIAFVIYRRMHRGSPKANYKPSSEGCVSPRGMSSSPAITPQDDNPEIPLTGEITRKDFSVGVSLSRGPSINSTNSARYVLLGKKQCDSTGGSPKPSTRHYSPLPRHGANSPDEILAPDQIPDPKLWHSPRHALKAKSIHSPKKSAKKIGHNSPRDVSTSGKPLKSQNVKTKHEILTEAIIEQRREKDAGSDRVVTGASSTPTSQQLSTVSTCDTTQAVVNTHSGRRKPTRGDTHDGEKHSHRKEKSRSGERHSKSPENKSNRRVRSKVADVTNDSMTNDNEKSIDRLKRDRKHKPHRTKNEVGLGESVELTSSKVEKPQSKTGTTEFSHTIAKRPTSFVNQTSVGTDTCLHQNQPKIGDTDQIVAFHVYERTPMSVRDSSLPRPDGQSPETLREERFHSRFSTPSGSVTQSPAKTPGQELEYDDFIMDDPYSYFDPSQTMKLKWQCLSGGEAPDKNNLQKRTLLGQPNVANPC